MKGLSKSESLNLLERMGLNTVERVVLSYPFTVDEIFATVDMMYKDHKRVSMRSFTKNRVICPFVPNQDKINLEKFIRDNIDKVKIQDELIFAEGIDPRTSQMCGKIAHLPTGNMMIEYCKGPGTVRDMESMKASDLSRVEIPAYLGQDDKQRDNIFLDLIRLSKYFFRKYPYTVLEWSIYPHHIGKRKQHLIFWEAI